MAKTVLPDSVAIASHIKALDSMFGDRLSDLQIGVVMINLIDTAPLAALPFLAAQFNMLGYKGWKFADTEAKQRDLLKRAIDFHRYKGTKYGLKQALTFAGVIGAIEVRDKIVLRHNGEFYHEGIAHYGNHWAYFRVLIDVANINGLSLADIRGVIAEYKNARSWLLDVTYSQSIADNIGISDDSVRTVRVNVDDNIGIADALVKTP